MSGGAAGCMGMLYDKFNKSKVIGGNGSVPVCIVSICHDFVMTADEHCELG